MGAARKHTGTIVGVVVIAAAVILACALFLPHRGGGSAALVVVHDGDGVEHTLPLDENGSVTVTTSLGTNTIVVEGGAARVIDADCPNHDCMRQQPISRPGQQLICLPHELWVEVVEADGADGANALDVDAVVWDDAGVDTVAR